VNVEKERLVCFARQVVLNTTLELQVLYKAGSFAYGTGNSDFFFKIEGVVNMALKVMVIYKAHRCKNGTENSGFL
jgi:hypothetical protein